MSAINYIVPPFDLPNIKGIHIEGIFGDFGEVIARRIASLQKARHPLAKQRAAFFAYLLQQVDAKRYAEIQKAYLSPTRMDARSDLIKYLDPVVWFESKVALAVRLGLDRAPPRRVLDLGTGPGHFAVVARFYGHDVLGTELPQRSRGEGDSAHLYDALCGAFQVQRVSHTIRPYGDLSDLPGGFDIVTALLAAFNVDEQNQPWTTDHWRHFMRSLRAHVLAPQGEVLFNLVNNKVTPEAWNYLAARAAWAVDVNKSLFFSTLAQFA